MAIIQILFKVLPEHTSFKSGLTRYNMCKHILLPSVFPGLLLSFSF